MRLRLALIVFCTVIGVSVLIWRGDTASRDSSGTVSTAIVPSVVSSDSNVTDPGVNAVKGAMKSSARHQQSLQPGSGTALATAVNGHSDGKPWLAIDGWGALSAKEKLVRLISQPIGIRDRGVVVELELAKDELYLRDAENPKKRLTAIPLQTDAAGVLEEAERLSKVSRTLPQLVFYLRGSADRTDQTRRILSDEVLLQTANVGAAIASAKTVGLTSAKEMEASPGFVVGQDIRFPGAALVAAADMEGLQGVKEARPMLAMQQSHRLVMNDPLFSSQWHLKNTTTIHVNASAVWDTNRGSAVTVGIIDDGLQITHPDLSPNVDSSAPTMHFDYVDGDTDPSPYAPVDNPSTPFDNEAEEGDSHGTSVAGLTGARGNNNLGVSGVAPEVHLVGLRLTAGPASPSTEASAFGRRNDVIAVKNNSWGPSDRQPWVLGWADPVVQAAFANGVVTGRGGRGTIYTFAAGNGRSNGDQSNKDGYANNMHTFAIAALTKSGVPAYYSEYGTNIIASAPADGVTTTDLMGSAGYNPSQDSSPISSRDYSDEFNGTSAACPVASGVIALMLEANPNLGWRDVKEILLRSGRKVSATDTEWVSRNGGNPALPLIKHNPKYGGGMVDAGAAVALATSWTNLGAMTTLTKSNTTGSTIPDKNSIGITKTFDFSTSTPTRVETVEVEVDISHTYRGDLQIQLISPSGVISNLASQVGYDDDNTGYPGWVFTSVRHWGESSKGIWKLVMKDAVSGDQGTFNSASIRLHGVSAPPVVITSVTADAFVLSGESHSMNVVETGFPVISHQWTRNGIALGGATAASYNIASAATTDGGVYKVTSTNVTGSDFRLINLAVAQSPPSTYIANIDKTLVLSVPTKGPTGQAFTYEWRKDGTPLSNDPVGPTARISGVDKTTLTILKAADGDAGVYTCKVTTGAFVRTTTDCVVSIRHKPDIVTSAFPADLIVSRQVNIPLNISNGTTSVVITGLPAGLTYDKVTGTITGIPNSAVTGQQIKIKATNQAGTTETTVPLLLTIAALPEKCQGTFNGLIARNSHAQAGANYGGKLYNIVISKTGAITGKLYLANLSYPLNGRLVADFSGDATAEMFVLRAKPLPKLKLTILVGRSDGHITGTLEDVPAVPPAAWSSSVEAWRNPFSTATPNTGLLGYHNIWIDSPSTDGAQSPQGSGAGTISLSKTGGASISLKLSDGLAVTGSTTIGTTGGVSIFNMLYTNRGSIHGWVTILDQVPPAFNTASGTLTWNKLNIATERKYKAGIDFGVTNLLTLPVTGGEYVKPPVAVVPNPQTFLWGLPDVPKTAVNARLAFTGTAIEGDSLAVPAVPVAAMLADANTGVRISSSPTGAVPTPNLAAVKLSVNATTGTFSGTLTLQDGLPAVKRPVTYFGAIISAEQKGRGWFNVVRVPLTGETLLTAPIHSGKVELLPSP